MFLQHCRFGLQCPSKIPGELIPILQSIDTTYRFHSLLCSLQVITHSSHPKHGSFPELGCLSIPTDVFHAWPNRPYKPRPRYVPLSSKHLLFLRGTPNTDPLPSCSHLATPFQLPSSPIQTSPPRPSDSQSSGAPLTSSHPPFPPPTHPVQAAQLERPYQKCRTKQECLCLVTNALNDANFSVGEFFIELLQNTDQQFANHRNGLFKENAVCIPKILELIWSNEKGRSHVEQWIGLG